jgi:hypothetical protein
MKTLLLTAIILSVTASVEARSILTFKTVTKCETYKKGEPKLVLIQEAQDGQSQLVISSPLIPTEEALKIQTKKISPPPMNAGGTVKYVGKNDITKEVVTLAFGSIRPIKVGKKVGRAALLIVEKQDNVELICTNVK